MCRSIKKLRGDESVTDVQIEEAALQYVRKVSGYRAPSHKNAEAFEAAVREVTEASKKLLTTLA